MTESDPALPRVLYAPQYWPTWLGMAALRLLAKLPFRLQLGIGRGLGALLWLLPLPAKGIARTNLRLCFPELSRRQRERLLWQHFQSLGMAVAEFASAWWASETTLDGLDQPEGLENLHRALEQGKGVIMLGTHFTNLDLGGRLLRRHVPFAVMHRYQKNELFDRVMRQARSRIFTKAIEREDIRSLVRTLKDNGAVWYAPDQNYAGKGQVFAPFFGVPAATNSGTARLARMTGAPVLPFTNIRRADGKGYRLILGPVLENFPSGDPEQDTARVNAVIEAQVRLAPEQYLWVHRRFKNRPPGEERWY